MSDDSLGPIDALGVDTNKVANEPKEESVLARNNWSVGLVDSDSASESVVPDIANEESDGKSSNDEQRGNEYVDDGAENLSNDGIHISVKADAEIGKCFQKS